jgi:DNA (cytosine-5)-methyltransferase 3A
MTIKFLIGGSPCTHWSIAQKNNRETEPSGIGWELFKNYLIAKEKFKPNFFLYENNKSAAQAIKDQIAKELGVGVDPDVRFTYINSALVSAQNRQRFYVTNFGDIEQPEDRGILLKDILETGTDLSQNEKSYCMTASYDGAVAWNTLERSQRSMVAEPVCVAQRGRYKDTGNRSTKGEGGTEQFYEARTDGKTNALTTVQKDNAVAEPVRVGCYPSPDGTLKNSQGMRLYSIEGKSVNLTANGGGMGGKTGLYAIPIEFVDDVPVKAVSCADGKEYPVYQVLNGQIEIRNRRYDIKLPDGYYIIRKLTVTECCRLQTMPDDYCKAVSATQAYKGLGNGWTAEVIIHLLNHALKDVPRNEEIVVLSLYDGIGTGRYCLDKMGFTNVKYYAYEIDKYPMAIANDNYPDIIQCGDAFAVREDSWKPPLEVET